METTPADAKPQPEEPVKSIENDGKETAAEQAAVPEAPPKSQVTDEQWRAMMDVVMAIYEFREEE